MMNTKAEIVEHIDRVRKAIAQTEDQIQGTRGVIQDTLRIVFAIHKDELAILEAIAKKLPDEPTI